MPKRCKETHQIKIHKNRYSSTVRESGFGELFLLEIWRKIAYAPILPLNLDKSLRNVLDRGIDDMEAGRKLPLNEAMKKITELRNVHRNARL